MTQPILLALAAVAAVLPALPAADWPEWGRTPSKNMVSPETGIPPEISAGEGKTVAEIAASAKNLKWVARLGSQSYGTPTIGGGRVLVGTNNEEPRDPKIIGDRGVVLCFDEATGAFRWQLATPKLGAGKVSDWEFLGTCSSVTIDAGGQVGWVVTNRGEVLALDLDGLGNGNDGPFQDEAGYLVGGLDGADKKEPIEVGPQDADILWGFDLRGELGVFPHNITSSSVTSDGRHVFVTTSNGVDWSHGSIPAPLAPCLVALDKATGELVGEEGSGIGERILHCNWSSPAFVKHKGQEMVLFGAGDGFIYGFRPAAVKDPGGFDILPEVFRYDGNPKQYRFDKSGEPIKYGTPAGPSEFLATPVYHEGKIYAAIGQDPDHGEGLGLLSCLSADTEGESHAPSGALWTYAGIKRTLSTASVTDDGLIFIADYSGMLHCLDAATGLRHWVHDTGSRVWGSTLVVDGRVYLGTADGNLIVIRASAAADADGDGRVQEDEVLATVAFPAPLHASPVAANGTLYVTTQTHLYAFARK